MTKEENIATLNEHLEHWKRLLSEKICDQNEGEKTIDALQNAIKALEQEPCEVSQGLVKDSQGFSQEPCEDAVSRRAVNEIINDAYYLKLDDGAALQESIHQLPSVTPQPKMMKCMWIKYDYRTICPKEHDVDDPYWRIPENRKEVLKYCPYCGLEIEIEGSDKE